METLGIEILQKNKIAKEIKKEAASCCGGAHALNDDACCKLDEEKKEMGEEGCGCNSTKKEVAKTSCC
jgi:hypothetical protein